MYKLYKTLLKVKSLFKNIGFKMFFKSRELADVND